MPAPQRAVEQSLPVGNGFAVVFRMSTIWLCVSDGATASINEIVPDTIGAARLVPPVCVIASSPGVVRPLFDSAKMLPTPNVRENVPPGADSVTPAPKLLYPARYPSSVVAATVMTPEQLAG